MKYANITRTCIKILILTGILLAFIQAYGYFSEIQNQKNITSQNTNTHTFQSAESSEIGSIGVALSTRIGIQFQNGQNSGSQTESFYREITTIGGSPSENRAIRSDMISQNILIVSEYLNLSRANVQDLLEGVPDRRSTLEGYISQLEMRYKGAALSINNLQKQKDLLLQNLESLEAKIEQVKTNMETHFSDGNADETLNDVDDYFALRAEYTESFTDIVFINQFLKQYQFLNEYNIGVLDTIINNKEAIINQSYVVIPDSGSEYLRPFELLFDEAEIKDE